MLESYAGQVLLAGLGGFTTFSTLAYESLGLVQESDFAKAGANVALHVVIGFGAAWLGYLAARAL